MKKIVLKIMLFAVFLGSAGFDNSADPSKWSEKKLDSWFAKGEWLSGWPVKPDVSINKREFAKVYYKNRERWDKAFKFLKDNDLSKLELKKYPIEGDNLFATVSEYTSKNIEDSKFEGHKKYIDIQYVAEGSEMIGIVPESQVTKITDQYNPDNDIAFFAVGKFSEFKATPDRFFIFLPSDIHRPGVKVSDNSKVRKIVVKVKVD
jgi:YhcH/YjgK/YiaL family protein